MSKFRSRLIKGKVSFVIIPLKILAGLYEAANSAALKVFQARNKIQYVSLQPSSRMLSASSGDKFKPSVSDRSAKMNEGIHIRNKLNNTLELGEKIIESFNS